MHDVGTHVGNPELIFIQLLHFSIPQNKIKTFPNRSGTQFALIPALPMMRLEIKLKRTHKNLIYTKNRQLFVILIMLKANKYQYIALYPATSRTGTFGTIAGIWEEYISR